MQPRRKSWTRNHGTLYGKRIRHCKTSLRSADQRHCPSFAFLQSSEPGQRIASVAPSFGTLLVPTAAMHPDCPKGQSGGAWNPYTVSGAMGLLEQLLIFNLRSTTNPWTK